MILDGLGGYHGYVNKPALFGMIAGTNRIEVISLPT